ncbi:MAG: DAK2 domain-containing protein [Clostridia bacterium]|nr:DAK2 domain-containing protein [Clostridia bacterium]
MALKSINGRVLRRLIIAGANELNLNRQLVDSLNVFPVPDGDTGTNMSLTILAAAREVEKSNSESISEIAKLASNGSLRGARGNSGVILSQLIRGFAKGLDSLDEADISDLSEAFQNARSTAYKAVMKPKEGTILTVATAVADASAAAALETDNSDDFLERVIKNGNEMLEKTTEMLPALKQAGVVDAGGKGLMFILIGALSNLKNGKDETIEDNINQTQQKISTPIANTAQQDIKFGYCTEFFVLKKNPSEKEVDMLRKYLSSIGDSLIVVADDDVIKVHVHTNHPGQAIEKALSIGALNGLKIDNMRIQHTSKINFENQIEEPQKERGFISVSSGAGLSEIFKNMGADGIIYGGQTMNPSTDDILKAIEKVNAKTVFVLPNNKNIILASEQASEMCTDKKVIVIPTTSIPEGIAALINYDESLDEKTAVENMKDGMEYIKSLSMTFAVRDTSMGGIEIKKGDYLGMNGGKIVAVSNDMKKCLSKLIEKAVDRDSEVITVYYGSDVSEEDAEKTAEDIRGKYPDCEVELYDGGQPVYYYIISVE